MIASRYAALLHGLLLSALMSLLVSGISSWRASPVATAGEFIGVWISAWLTAWLLAFPALLLLAPLVRAIVSRLTAPPSPADNAPPSANVHDRSS